MLLSGHDTVIAIMISQKLWLLALGQPTANNNSEVVHGGHAVKKYLQCMYFRGEQPLFSLVRPLIRALSLPTSVPLRLLKGCFYQIGLANGSGNEQISPYTTYSHVSLFFKRSPFSMFSLIPEGFHFIYTQRHNQQFLGNSNNTRHAFARAKKTDKTDKVCICYLTYVSEGAWL